MSPFKEALLSALRRAGEELAILGEKLNEIAVAVASEGDTLEDDEVVRLLRDGADDLDHTEGGSDAD